MPSLERTYEDYDIGLLRAMADTLGIELDNRAAKAAAVELAQAVYDVDVLDGVFGALADDPKQALAEIAAAGGRLPVVAFMRKFGEIRPLGLAAREKERPWDNPANAAELLYYRGLIGRGFFSSGRSTPEEFVYIPDELLDLLPEYNLPAVSLPGGRAVAIAPPNYIKASSNLVDDATTVLAYLQLAQPDVLGPADRTYLQPFLFKPEALDFVVAVLRSAGLISRLPLKPVSRVARPFLEADRGTQLQQLIHAWLPALDIDDLGFVPGLTLEDGGPARDPGHIRTQLFAWLRELQPGEWRRLDDLVERVKTVLPDFQRPNGNYNTLYIRDNASGQYLSGFETWEAVDGALLRYLITRPLHWLGMTDITDPGDDIPRFRLTERVFAPISNGQPVVINYAEQPISVKTNGVLLATRAASRFDRFQLARIADWVADPGERYRYRISAASLDAANKDGVSPAQALAFLRKAIPDLPQYLDDAVTRFDEEGTELRVGLAPVLRVKNEATLAMLQDTPVLAKLLGDVVGPKAVLVPQRNWHTLQRELLKRGLLIEIDD